MMRLQSLLWCFVLSLSACAGTADPGTLEVGRQGDPVDDLEPQGRELTGDRVHFREASLNTFADASGATLYAVHLDRAQLRGWRVDATPVQALDFVGAKFHGSTADGDALFTI